MLNEFLLIVGYYKFNRPMRAKVINQMSIQVGLNIKDTIIDIDIKANELVLLDQVSGQKVFAMEQPPVPVKVKQPNHLDPCRTCFNRPTVFKSVKVDHLSRIEVFWCGCLVNRNFKVDGFQHKVPRLVFVSNGELQGIITIPISIHGNDGIWMPGLDYFWFNKTKVMFREHGPKVLYEIALDKLAKAGGRQVEPTKVVVPDQAKTDRVSNVDLLEDGRYAVLWNNGSFTFPSNPDILHPPLKSANLWHLIRVPFKNRLLISGILSSPTKFALTLSLVISTNKTVRTVTIDCVKRDRLFCLQKLQTIKQNSNQIVLLGVSGISMVHIFHCTPNRLAVVDSNLSVNRLMINCNLILRESPWLFTILSSSRDGINQATIKLY